MEFLLGTAALVSSVLGYAWALGLSRSDTAPDWARSQLFASGISLVIVGLAPLGVGFIAYGFGNPFDTLSWIGVGTMAVSLPVLWVVTPRLARRRAGMAVSPLPVPPPAPAPIEPAPKLAA